MSEASFTIPGAQLLGKRVLYFDTIASTNSHALSLASDRANDGVVVLAGAQTAGRGQHGRTWTAPPKSSVLMSVLLFPPPSLRRAALLTAWAAVSVCRLIQHFTGSQALIKWPNDVLLGGRKVCGILIEQRALGRDELATVAGIGLNVSQPAEWFAATGLTAAAALADFAKQPLDCRRIAEELILRLDEEYQQLLQGRLETLEAAWKACLGLIGRQVLVEAAGADYQGRLVDVTFGGLSVEVRGQNIRLPPEAVRHIHADAT